MKQVMGNSAVSKSRRNLGELSGTSFGQRRYQSALRDRSDAESGISISPSCNHSESYSPTRDLLTAEPAVCTICTSQVLACSCWSMLECYCIVV